jgi:nitrite reductase (NADH) large subunit
VKKRVLVAGFGMAAQRLLEELAPWEPEIEVTVLSQEPVVAYDRIKLSTVLAQAGLATPDLSLKPAAWHEAHGYRLRLGESLASLDLEARRATTDKGAVLDYDELVLATGSDPLLPPIPGIQLPGVHVFRRLSDCQALQSASKPGLPAVVLGGGLLGLEAAKGLLNLGCSVTVVHLMDRLMERQLTPAPPRSCARTWRPRGCASSWAPTPSASSAPSASKGCSWPTAARSPRRWSWSPSACAPRPRSPRPRV